MSDRVPAEIFPPGEFLQDELDARGWTQTQFAEIIGRKHGVINELVLGKRAITPETAQELAAALGTSAQFWIILRRLISCQKSRCAPQSELREKRHCVSDSRFEK